MIFFLLLRLNIFTSKISNLVLPLGAEEAGDFEPYLTSEIPSKYIYDAFSMIYLSILLLLFSHFLALQRSYSDIHKGCNSVVL